MSCALHVIGKNQDNQVNFVTCTSFSSGSNGYKTYEQCAEALKLDWSEVEACAAGELGTELQLQMEKDSAVIKTSGHVPTLTFGGKYVAKEFWEAFSDFYGVVERKLEEIAKTEM